MALSIYKYAHAAYHAYKGNITDLEDGATEVRVALMDDNFSFNQSTDESWADVSEDEIDEAANTGYTAGGEQISNATWEVVGNQAIFDGDDVTWEESEITARWGVIYDDTPGDDADKKLLAVIDFEEEKSTAGGPFSIEWHEDGIFAADAL